MFPKKKYQIIYADPPWLFRVRSEKGNKRSATNHYDVMSVQDIKDMLFKISQMITVYCFCGLHFPT